MTETLSYEDEDGAVGGIAAFADACTFRALIEQASDMVTVVRPDGTIAYTNGAVEEVLGYAPDERIGQSALEHVHPEDRETLQHALERAVAMQGQPTKLECRFRHKDGSWRALESTGRYIQNQECEEGVAVYTRDITPRKHYEAELKRARAMAEEVNVLKTAFLENMSHELRTPLTGILGSASILAEEVTGPQRDLIEVIAKSGERLLETVNALLDLALVEAGTLKLNTEVFDVVPVVRQKVWAWEHAANERGLLLVFSADKLACWVELDRARLQRILESLLSNALKFSERGEVRVHVGCTSSEVAIRVQDEGVGISEAFLQKMFEAFYQESTGDARLYEGLGLGLTITNYLTQKMGGAVTVESEKGNGSAFTVSFPCIASNRGEEDRSVTASTKKLQRVLVVDDDPDTCQLLTYMLRDIEQVDTVGTATQALEHARQQTYDAILLDINLGRDSGTTVLQHLRQLPGYQAVPIVALTVYASPHDRRRLLRAGFDEHIGKPFGKRDVLRVLKTVETSTVLPKNAS